MIARRMTELFAIGMIGEGVLATFFPEKHLALWHMGPDPLRRIVGFCERRPNVARALAALEAGAGLWLASRQFNWEKTNVPVAAKGRETLNALVMY